MQLSVSASSRGLQHARSLLSFSLIWDTVELNQVEEFRPEFAQWQPIASLALMVDNFDCMDLFLLSHHFEFVADLM